MAVFDDDNKTTNTKANKEQTSDVVKLETSWIKPVYWYSVEFSKNYLLNPLQFVYNVSSDQVKQLILVSKETPIVDTTDKISSYVGISSSIGMASGLILGLCPITAPIGYSVLAASSLTAMPNAFYGTGRSAYTLLERYKMGESISLQNAEARSCWLNTSCGVLSAATTISTDWLANASSGGYMVSDWVRYGITGLSVANLTTSIASFVNSAYNISAKSVITVSDMLHLSTSMAFLLHNLTRFKTSDNIIKEVQSKEIEMHRVLLSKKSQKAFDEVLRAYKEIGASDIKSQGKFLRDMNTAVDSVKDFYKQLKFTSDKLVRMNEEFTVHPRALAQLSKEERDLLMDQTRKLHDHEISLNAFKRNTKDVLRQYRFKADRDTIKSAEFLKEKFDIDVKRFKIGDKNYKLQPHEINRLTHLCKNLCKKDPDMFKFGKEIATQHNVKDVHEFQSMIEFTARNVNKERQILQTANPNLSAHRKYYQQQAIKSLNDSNKLNNTFTEWLNQFRAINSKDLQFKNIISAVNHYDKHAARYADKISPEKYLDLANSITKKNPLETKWTQNGEAVNYFYQTANGICVTYRNILNKSSFIASLYNVNAK